MITPHRRRTLGDVGANAPEHVAVGRTRTRRRPICCCCCLLATRPTLEPALHGLSATFASGGVSEILELDADIDWTAKNTSASPTASRNRRSTDCRRARTLPPNTVRPGEFILGYPNEYGRYTPIGRCSNRAPTRARARRWMRRAAARPTSAATARYLVFRHLRAGRARRSGSTSKTRRARRTARAIRARRVAGREDGRPVAERRAADARAGRRRPDPGRRPTTSPTTSPTSSGFSCPVGAHVRRAHPRDSLDPYPGHRAVGRARSTAPAVAPRARVRAAG